jgi:hypothetical protein
MSGTKRGSMVPLPAHFERLLDPSTGKYYYFNKLTQKVTWRRPDPERDALNPADSQQIFPPAAPTDAPPADASSPARMPEPILAPVAADGKSIKVIKNEEPSADLPAILPSPPSQPRRTSRVTGPSQQLQPPPPVPTETAAVAPLQPTLPIREDEELASSDDSDNEDDDDDESSSKNRPPPVPSMPAALAAAVAASMAAAPAAAAPAEPSSSPDVPSGSAVPASAQAAEPVQPSVAAPEESRPAVIRQVTFHGMAGLRISPSSSPPPSAEVAPPSAPVVKAAEAAAAEPAAAAETSALVPAAAPVLPSAAAPASSSSAAAAVVDDDADVEEDDEWDEFTDAVSGKTFFVNKKTKVTTWTNPFTTSEGTTTSTTAAAAEAAAPASSTAAPAPSSSSSSSSAQVVPSSLPGPSVSASLTQSSSPFPSPMFGGWSAVSIRGRWDASSAAGCYPNFSSWVQNPQFHVGISEEDANSGAPKTQVVIQLQWDKLRRADDAAATSSADSAVSQVAGFYVLSNSGPSYQKLYIHADEVVARSDFEAAGNTTLNMLLESFSAQRPGPVTSPFVRNYTLVPSTFEPGYVGDFTLTVHSARPGWIQPVSPADAWREHSLHGQWAGATAGGCRNHAATFPFNPQYTLRSSLPGGGSHPVLVLLTQQGDGSGDAAALHAIGWYAVNSAGKIEAKGPFQSNLEVHAQFVLQSDTTLTLVPCTFSPGLEGAFTLAVYAPPQAQITFEPVART